MRRVFIIFFIIIPLFSFAQRKHTDNQWTEDLNFMINRLDSTHPNLYANISKDQFHLMSDELKKNIPNLTDNEIIVELLRIITSIQDGHTRLHGKNLTKTWYPLRVEKFSDGYFITATSIEYTRYIGSKVITINNYPIEDVFEKIKNITPHDNLYSQEYFAPMYLTMNSILSGIHVIGLTNNEINIRLITNDGKENELILNPVQYSSNEELSWFWRDYGVPAYEYSNILKSDSLLPYYLQNYDKSFWYKYIDEKKTIYFAFNECSSDENENFSKFNSKLWRSIDSLNVEYLIIDLRNNFGGTNSILKPLIHDIIKNDVINQKGHLFIITSRKTFSAAMHCAIWIEFQCNPIFAGESTGSAPNHYADPDFSILPNSKILLMISKYY